MSESETEVSHEILSEWRNSGIISAEEVVFKSGDLLVAENVITKARRIITPQIRETVRNKRILKG
jgi:hypothetical protein